MHAYPTLIYPPHYPPTGRWKRFFIGVRWLGPDLAFFKDLRALQASRTVESMLIWGGGVRQELAASIGATFSTHLRWPAPYFLPMDSVAVIVAGPKFAVIDDFAAEDAVAAVEEHLGIRMGTSFWKDASSDSFGSLVDRLSA